MLETYIFHELRAYQDHAGCGGAFAYWGTPARAEVDFVWTRARRAVAIEVKPSPRWRSEDGRALGGLLEAGIVGRGLAVYEGADRLRAGSVDVLPVETFLRALHAGEVIG